MQTPQPLFLPRRMRRLRRTPGTRALLQETRVTANDLVAPLFVRAESGPPDPVPSMPGVHRFGLDDLLKECVELLTIGIRAVALFPRIAPQLKDPHGAEALNSQGLIPQTIRAIKQECPALQIITDIALDPYTSHGHDGVLDFEGNEVDNDLTVNSLAQMAVITAKAGADWVAPSDMMDGRVGAIRKALDGAGLIGTGILAYSVKFASAYYGPFREAVGSQSPAASGYLDKQTYQLNPANSRESLQEAKLDEDEGADILMVKPAGPYLDVLARLRMQTGLPLAAYQVSGEYAQIQAAAANGWLDLKSTRDEALLAIKRAGADLILTYFAKDFARDSS